MLRKHSFSLFCISSKGRRSCVSLPGSLKAFLADSWCSFVYPVLKFCNWLYLWKLFILEIPIKNTYIWISMHFMHVFMLPSSQIKFFILCFFHVFLGMVWFCHVKKFCYCSLQFFGSQALKTVLAVSRRNKVFDSTADLRFHGLAAEALLVVNCSSTERNLFFCTL